ncbi:MAG: acylneuraminate cytidylyltransferase family protein [Candidatus Omnitrophota bacterium]
MYKNKRVVCIIPVRGGSKGLPGKNIKMFLGKPLIARSIKQAKDSGLIDRIIVSTDDKKIADISKKYGAEVPFIRPKFLAQDKSSTIDVLLHAMGWLQGEGYPFDILVLLHATAPLRSVQDINNCIKLLVNQKADNVFSVTEANRNPYFNMVEVVRGKVKLVKEGRFSSRQQAPKVYDMNASIYVWWKDVLDEKKGIFLKNSKVYVMPKIRSIDIDDYMDFKIAEIMMVEGNKNKGCAF